MKSRFKKKDEKQHVSDKSNLVTIVSRRDSYSILITRKMKRNPVLFLLDEYFWWMRQNTLADPLGVQLFTVESPRRWTRTNTSKALFPLTHRGDDVVPSVNERDPISRDKKRDSKLPVYAASREEAVTDRIAYRRQRKIASNHRHRDLFLLFNPSAWAKRTLRSKLDHERRAWTSFNF